MLKLRRQNKIPDYHCKTETDEIRNNTSYRFKSQDPQQSLFQISLKANEQQYGSGFTVWNRQIVKPQTINFTSSIANQQGCFDKILRNLKSSNVMLNKKQLQLKKWKEKKFRQSELKKSIVSSQKRKLCLPINFNQQNHNDKKITTRIHSRTISTSFYTPNQIRNQNQRSKSQICCDLQQLKQTSEQKREKQEQANFYKENKRLQYQLIIHKKKPKALRQTSDSDQEETSFRSPSYSKYFTMLNTLLQEQKKKVLFPLKRLCPTAKLKGIFNKRRHSVNK